MSCDPSTSVSVSTTLSYLRSGQVRSGPAMGKTSPTSLRRPSSFQSCGGRSGGRSVSDKVMEALLVQKNQGKLSNSALGWSGNTVDGSVSSVFIVDC